MSDLIEALARALFEWNTPTDPYFVIRGRTSEMGDGRDPYLPIVEAILADPARLLDALPDDVLIEALVRRGALVEEHVEEAPPPPPPEPVECCASGRCGPGR